MIRPQLKSSNPTVNSHLLNLLNSADTIEDPVFRRNTLSKVPMLAALFWITLAEMKSNDGEVWSKFVVDDFHAISMKGDLSYRVHILLSAPC